jgi:hypothetical protein
MSGGSHDYICYKIESELVGQMYDTELNDLMQDIAELAHDVEWYDSSDIGKETYLESVRKFKQKWFKGNREERLKGYIDYSIDNLRTEMYNLIGVKNNGKEI